MSIAFELNSMMKDHSSENYGSGKFRIYDQR